MHGVLSSINKRSTNGTDYMVKTTPLQSHGGTACLPNKTCGNCLSFLSEQLSFTRMNRCLSLASYCFHLVCSAGDVRFTGRLWRRRRRRMNGQRAVSVSAWLHTELFTFQTKKFKRLLQPDIRSNRSTRSIWF